ncbi:hypothetical protein [Sphingomonas sp. S2-65]|uniref:hypothetical protein n=1 Tax=Sphingomonas sp. S2-65 TaxID=2903960 RepID=UPI001F2AE59C|nr:hypothetical protein [Sphingomonas sp. S2-65]UYY57806.1 hypothetical protein LZ586_14220 [Sphingomonas sp. S2-65]
MLGLWPRSNWQAPRHATHGINPAELDKLEAKLERDRETVARRVFQASTLDDLSLETPPPTRASP